MQKENGITSKNIKVGKLYYIDSGKSDRDIGVVFKIDKDEYIFYWLLYDPELKYACEYYIADGWWREVSSYVA